MHTDRLKIESDVIARFFQLSNKLQTTLDQGLKRDGLTIKQFFLMIVVDSFDHEPGFSEISERFGTSRQNVKQLALKLSKHGYVSIETDPQDARFKRLALTQKAKAFWEKRDPHDQTMLNKIFQTVPTDELIIFLDTMTKMETELITMEKEQKGAHQ